MIIRKIMTKNEIEKYDLKTIIRIIQSVIDKQNKKNVLEIKSTMFDFENKFFAKLL